MSRISVTGKKIMYHIFFAFDLHMINFITLHCRKTKNRLLSADNGAVEGNRVTIDKKVWDRV
jgi:uncharacterized protein YhbP (UPF0306 family)